jgi:hypothetical protein
MTLEDSTTYQLILNKGLRQGEARGEQDVVLLVGGQRFGKATPEVEAAVRAITDRVRLERVAARLLSATDWNDLLATT